MIDIILQINKSENTAFNKKITDVVTINGTLKEVTSLIEPVVQIDVRPLTMNEFEDLIKKVNYMSISTFGRSYFVVEKKIINEYILEISGKVDVLVSFKDEILANRAIISKQENKWNTYLNDGTFKIYQNPYVVTKKFPQGFNNFEFVLAIAGNRDSG